MCLEFLLLHIVHSCGCQLISDEYEWMNDEEYNQAETAVIVALTLKHK